jgi:hypothetical protein
VARFNADEATKALFEPIEITIDGKDYSIESLPADLIEGLAENTGVAEDDKSYSKALAKLIGVAPKTFEKTDVRKLIIVYQHIQTVLAEHMEIITKNAQKVGVVPTP